MATCDYNCAELPDHLRVDCNEYTSGGVPSVAFIECDASITDYSSDSDWTTAISAGDAKIIKGVRGSLAEPSPVDTTNPVGGEFESFTRKYDYTFTFMDMNVTATNQAFYNALKDRRGYFAWYNSDSDKIWVIDSAKVNFQVLETQPEASDELIGYTVNARFRTSELTDIYDAPAGIFDV